MKDNNLFDKTNKPPKRNKNNYVQGIQKGSTLLKGIFFFQVGKKTRANIEINQLL